MRDYFFHVDRVSCGDVVGGSGVEDSEMVRKGMLAGRFGYKKHI